MERLFESENLIAHKVREVVQLLLTDAFVDAKYFWLTNICSFSPDADRNILDSFGTDKQVTLYHTRDIFQRTYQYLCSSDKCPSNLSKAVSPVDVVSDMTLHEPKDGIGLTLERSIKEWESASSENAFISCKERFTGVPDHSEYISELDCGESVVRCAGWRNMLNISFVDRPPLLLFDIAAPYRDKLLSLNDVPQHVFIYDVTYRLGGLTSYVSSRQHYVGYVAIEGGFLFYDGLPATKPVPKKVRHAAYTW